MKIVEKYSHLNGEEFLMVHNMKIYDEIKDVISKVDASKFLTKESKEKTKVGRTLYNPDAINREFKRLFTEYEWEEVRRDYFISSNYDLVKVLEPLSYAEQKEYVKEHELKLLHSYNQTDFVKEKIAVEIQLGKYFAVTYDLFVKHLSFYNAGIINLGIEIVPSKELQTEMSSGVPFFEKEVHNVLRHGRTTPPVPIIIFGVSQ
ncbi:MAG TPA: restriction endonuclease [Anaerolineaceae bacterium]|nr:restriction endonuclease [Anaerolineaceae bacterium]